MWQKILQKLQTSILGGAFIVGSTWVVSKGLGLIRQRLIASTFGAEGADPIYAAFAIPDFLYGTLILGSFLTAFMPVFITYRQGNTDEAWRITRTMLGMIAAVFGILGLILLCAAEPIVTSLVGKNFDPAGQATTVTLTRIMSMNMLLFAVSNVFAGILQSLKRFLAVSFAPIFNNLGIIAGIMFLTPHFGPLGVAYGAVIGAIFHTTIQVVAAWRAGWRFGAGAGWRHPGVRQIGALLVPRTIGQSVTQINQFVNIPIATRLGAGNLSIFRWANDIQDVPISIMGVSMATVAFPRFIELLSQDRRQEFVAYFSRIVREILFIIIPVTVLFLQLRAQFVRVIIGAGEVSWDETRLTANTLAIFALSFFAQSLIPVLARSFYAMKDTITPVRITIFAVGLDIIGSLILGPKFGVIGLALSFTISSIINACLLIWHLHRRLGSLDEDKIIQSVAKIVGVTILMGLTVQVTKEAMVSLGLDLSRAIGVVAQAIGAGGIGLISYFVFASLFKIEEASMVTGAWRVLRSLFRIDRRGNGV